jgi:hypothetical protein
MRFVYKIGLAVLGLLAADLAPPDPVWGQQGTNVNPATGSVWTYLGPTYGAAWALPTSGSYVTTCSTMSGTLPWINWCLEKVPGVLSQTLHAAYPTGNVSTFIGVSTVLSAATDPTGANDFIPGIGFSSVVSNNGSKLSGVGVWSVCQSMVNGQSDAKPNICFGGNDIATSGPNLTNIALIGREIDVQAGSNNTLSTTQRSVGLQINAFGNGTYHTGVFVNSPVQPTAWFTNAYEVGNIQGTGLLAVPGAQLSALVDTGVGASYTGQAIVVRNGHGVSFTSGVVGAAANLYMADSMGTGMLHLQTNPTGLDIQAKADQHLVVRQNQNMTSGIALSSVNDLNTIVYPMEIEASPLYVSGSFRIQGAVVSALPTCNTTQKFYMLVVTDASAPTWNAIVAGAGTTPTLVMCDGTNWRVH